MKRYLRLVLGRQQFFRILLVVVFTVYGLPVHGQGAVDLTDLIKTPDDEQETTSSTEQETAPSTDIEEDKTQKTPLIGNSLKAKDPNSIRLSSIGIERGDIDGLDRLMWRGSDTAVISGLFDDLAGTVQHEAFFSPFSHILVARSSPPQDFSDQATIFIEQRLQALSAAGLSDDLAMLVRQLPRIDEWAKWDRWLVFHDLFVGNDDEACHLVRERVKNTLDALWHQINAFCSVIDGNIEAAIFAVDILEERGIDDANYFTLMRKLTGARTDIAGDLTSASLLDLVLMDSTGTAIDRELLSDVPSSYYQSLTRLRHLSPVATRFVVAQQFRQHIADGELATVWALLPRADESSAEALLKFSSSDNGADAAVARLQLWQAIMAETDAELKTQFAFEAWKIDNNRLPTLSTNLWLPLIEAVGADDISVEKTGALLGFGENIPQETLTVEAANWRLVMAAVRQEDAAPINFETLAMLNAFDALPLLAAADTVVTDIDWLAQIKNKEDQSPVITPPLVIAAEGLPYDDLKRLEAVAEAGRKAETLMRAMVLMKDISLHQLNREDGAAIVGALKTAGLEVTAQNLARDILTAWGVHRHFMVISALP